MVGAEGGQYPDLALLLPSDLVLAPLKSSAGMWKAGAQAAHGSGQ